MLAAGCIFENNKSILSVKDKQRAAAQGMSHFAAGENCWHSSESEAFCLCTSRACARVHAPVSLQRDVAFDGDKRVCPLQNARMQRFSPGTDLCSCGSWSSRPSGRRGRGPGWAGGPPGSVHSREFHDAPDRTSSSGGTCCSLSTADAARETMTRLEWGKGQKGGIKRCLTHLLLKLRGNWHSHTH